MVNVSELRTNPVLDIAEIVRFCSVTRAAVPSDKTSGSNAARTTTAQTFGTAMPRCTAGRAEMRSYQRLTFGKSLRSVLCHSWRATQG